MQNKGQPVWLGMAGGLIAALVGLSFGWLYGLLLLGVLLFWPSAALAPNIYNNTAYPYDPQIDDLADDIIIDGEKRKEKVYASDQKQLCTHCSMPVTNNNALFCTSCGERL